MVQPSSTGLLNMRQLHVHKVAIVYGTRAARTKIACECMISSDSNIQRLELLQLKVVMTDEKFHLIFATGHRMLDVHPAHGGKLFRRGPCPDKSIPGNAGQRSTMNETGTPG